jgi:hypothetical protein
MTISATSEDSGSEGEPMPTPSSTPSESTGRFDRLVNWLGANEKYFVWLQWPFALAAAIYFVFIAIAETGPICRYGHDVFSFLDGGWRIYNGQMPYRDFNLPLGPLEYLIMAGGMLLTKGSTQGIAIGNAAFGVIIAIWGWLLARRRMPVIPALLVVAWLILTAASPTPLGHATPDFPSCAMLYNRHAYALLGLVLVECAFASERSRFWGGFSSGAALALMALLKLNFFGIAGLFLLASVAASQDTMPRFKGCLAGIACVALAITIYLRLAILTFFSDIWLAVEARRSRLQLLGTIHGLLGRAETLILVLMTLAAVLLLAPGRLRQRRSVTMFLLGGIVIASTPLFLKTDSGETHCQLATLWATILVGALATAFRQSKEKVAVSAVIALCLVAIFAQFFLDARSVQTLVRFNDPVVKAEGFAFANQGMERVKFYDIKADKMGYQFDNGHFQVDQVNDGLTLLEKFSTPDESIFTLGYNNPFTYILQRKPALGGSVWLQIGDNFPANHPISGDRLFGDARLVMLANYPSDLEESNAALAETYRPYLSQHFVFVASSQWWSLYRRTG